MLVVRVLGGLELELDGVQLAPPRRRPARALLGWLALHPGMHARSTVAGRLWPYVLDSSARVSLRTALAALRVAIGGEANRLLLATRDQVGLADPPVVWVDTREFEQLLRQGRREEALELCRGELLPGLDDEWVLAARDAQRAAEGELLGTLATAAAEAGDLAGAVGLARRRIGLDPLDEQAQRDLMHQLVAAGDRAGALASYKRLAEHLRRELGVAPSPPTRALATELRAGPAPAATAAGEADAAEHPSPFRPSIALPARIDAACRRGQLLAREEPLATLHALWRRSAVEGRQLGLVSGEPGIGKTRLVSEFAAELHRQGATVLYGRAEQDEAIPYQPLAECLREPLAQLRTLPDEVADLSDVLPYAARRLGRRASATASPGVGAGARLRLFEAFGAVLDAIGAERPLLLVLDDLHWAERSTMRLLVHLAGRPSGAPQLLVGAYRDTDLHGGHPVAAGLIELERELQAEWLALDGLSRAGVAAMLASEPADQPPGRDVVQAVHRQTGGNPFFVEQLLRDGAPLAPTSRRDQPPAAGIRQFVSGRVSALGPDARVVLGAAAVSGPEFELPLVAEAAGTPVGDTLDVLDNAVRARLVAEVPGEPGRYTFVHAIVRDALTGSMTAARRSLLHDRIATALEQQAADVPDRYLLPLAHHALEAARGGGDPERAVDLAERAAGRAGAVLAHEDAADLLRRALSVLERRGGTTARRAELQCALAEAMQHTGSREEARATLRSAQELARETDRSDLIARVALATGGAGVTILGADRDVLAELEHALGAVGSDNPRLRVRLLARLAIELAYDADSDRRNIVSEEMLELARGLGDPAALASALNARHVVLWGPDHTRERLELAGEMLDLAQRAHDLELALQARNWRIVDLLELGEGPNVRRELDAYASLSTEARLPAYAWYLPMWRATIALLDGRSGRGLELARRAHALGRRAGDANAAVFYAEQQFLQLVVERRVRDFDPAAFDVDDVDAWVVERADHGPAWRAYRFTFAWAHAERGELDLARRDYKAALADGLATLPRDVNWLSALSSAALTAALLEDTDQAQQLLTLLEPFADRIVVTARGSSYAGSVAYHLARLAATCSEHEQADHLFTEAARRDEHAGAPTMVVRDLQHHSQFLHRIGQHKRAVDLRRQAASWGLVLGTGSRIFGEAQGVSREGYGAQKN